MVPTAPLAGECPEVQDTVWQRSAPPAPTYPRVSSNISAEVLIIGAGFTGLTAALALQEAGKDVVLIDAVEPGWGASGRNNGQVIAGFKWDPEDLENRFGREHAGKLIAWGGNAPSIVFDLIDRHRIQCHPVRNGWIQPAYTDLSLLAIASRCRQWATRGAPVSMVDTASLPQVLGTPIFRGAWLDQRGGSINPLAFAQGLASAAAAKGAKIYSHTPALNMRRQTGNWIVACPDGKIQAERVVIATAAYADDLVPGLRRAMVPVRTAQVATAPLPQHFLESILPGRQVASDTRRLLTSFRISPDNRLVMGGSGATATLDHRYIVSRLHRSAREMFAHLGELPWEFAWSGYFAVTKDHVPHLHEPPDGLICGLGCNGRGIAISVAMGQLMAQRLMGLPIEAMPLRPTPIKPFVFHAFRHLGVALATRYYGLRDRIDQTRSVNR